MFIFPKLRIILLLLPLWLIACKKDKDASPEKFYDELKTQQNTAKSQQSIKHYTVKTGDTLFSIGKKYNHSYLKIADWNNIQPPYQIVIGQKIKFLETPVKIQKPLTKSLSIPPQKSQLSKPTEIKSKIKLSQSQPKFLPLKQQPPKLELPQPKSQNEIKKFKFDAYIVKTGDTLYSISRNFGVDHYLIEAANKIHSPNQLYVGQKLKIPNIKQKHSEIKIAQTQLITIKNLGFKPQKSSIISNNNENMLKFYCHWPIEGKILKSFSKTGNRGIEISGKAGQKVRAVAAGQVVAVNSSLYGHGKFIVIKHNNLYMSSYANNRRTLVKQGQKVKQGQVIAEIGQIGYKKPLLKFEIRKNGKHINPIHFLPKR